MPIDTKLEVGKPFLIGSGFGVAGYLGACRLMKVNWTRKPWNMIATMLLTGAALQAYSGFYDTVTEDLLRKRRLFVQRRKKRFVDENVVDIQNDKELYQTISKDLNQ
ncbi:hypothetical protein ABK040_005669 [Willaertia magna]